MRPSRAELSIETLEPRLTERVRHRLKQGYCEMLSRDVLVCISHYFLHIIDVGGCHDFRKEGVKNRVVNHGPVTVASLLKPGQGHEWRRAYDQAVPLDDGPTGHAYDRSSQKRPKRRFPSVRISMSIPT